GRFQLPCPPITPDHFGQDFAAGPGAWLALDCPAILFDRLRVLTGRLSLVGGFVFGGPSRFDPYDTFGWIAPLDPFGAANLNCAARIVDDLARHAVLSVATFGH